MANFTNFFLSKQPKSRVFPWKLLDILNKEIQSAILIEY